MTEQAFINFVQAECTYFGVTLDLRHSKYVIYEGTPCAGCFDDTNKRLICATKRKDYLAILAHEYCHMTQWAEKAPVWLKANEDKSYEYFDQIKPGNAAFMAPHIDNMREVELDNEKRTVRLIKKFDLPIDVKDYTRKANAYIMFYNFMKISGKWCKPGNAPYGSKRLLAALPDKFSMDYSRLPKRLEKIFREEGI